MKWLIIYIFSGGKNYMKKELYIAVDPGFDTV
ncbi:hypothetical protein Q604_UNBc4C00252G0001, partial [human gut metagenome]